MLASRRLRSSAWPLSSSSCPDHLVRLAAAVLIVCGAWLCAGSVDTRAQELDCTVTVNFEQLSGSDYEYLRDLQRLIAEYLNDRTWTDDRFRPQERIDCSVQIFIEQAVGLTEFDAQLIVAARRPIYETAQSTPTFRVKDSWTFKYARGTPLVFDLNRFDRLTSVLDFYAFMILGYDYDTFSELGGTPHFEEARRIANLAESEGASGWSGIVTERTRAALIAEILNPRFRRLREVMYAYHRNGLDRFVAQTEPARQVILEQVETLRDLTADVNRSYAVDLFFGAKFQELTAVFEDAPTASRAYGLLTDVDPSHSSTYNRLVN